MDFVEFDKISRLNRDVVVTEKIDGTNGQIHIRRADAVPDSLLTSKFEYEEGYDTKINIFDVPHFIRAGSRSRWVVNVGSDDNSGFGRWVKANAEELAKLGEGAHFGEWWGAGIQRKYGLNDKRFSLFNVHRWTPENKPTCCLTVPIISEDVGFDCVYEAIEFLKRNGSVAAPGFLKPEGVVAFHTHSRALFKMTIEKDQEHKWEQK